MARARESLEQREIICVGLSLGNAVGSSHGEMEERIRGGALCGNSVVRSAGAQGYRKMTKTRQWGGSSRGTA